MKCSDCGRTNPPGGVVLVGGARLYVCQNRIDCRIAQREKATAPDKLLNKQKAPVLPGLEGVS